MSNSEVRSLPLSGGSLPEVCLFGKNMINTSQSTCVYPGHSRIPAKQEATGEAELSNSESYPRYPQVSYTSALLPYCLNALARFLKSALIPSVEAERPLTFRRSWLDS